MITVNVDDHGVYDGPNVSLLLDISLAADIMRLPQKPLPEIAQVLDPDGRLIGAIDLGIDGRPDAFLNKLRGILQHMDRTNLRSASAAGRAGAIGRQEGERAVPDARPSPMVEVTARFLAATPGAPAPVLPQTPPHQPLQNSLPAPESLWKCRLDAPSLETFPLLPAWIAALSPWSSTRRMAASYAPTRVGTVYEIDPSIARALLWRFAPPTHNCHPCPSEVEEAQLHARVEAVDARSVTVRLTGHIRKRHPWFPTEAEQVSLEGQQIVDGRDYHYADSDVVGYAVFGNASEKGADVAQSLLSLKIVTAAGLYRGPDGTRMPFAAALQWRGGAQL